MNMNEQLYDFLNEKKKFMTAEEIIEAGFRFKGIKTTHQRAECNVEIARR